MPSEETCAKWSSLPVAECTLRSGEREKRKARESPNQGRRLFAEVRGHGVGRKAPKTRGILGSCAGRRSVTTSKLAGTPRAALSSAVAEPPWRSLENASRNDDDGERKPGGK
jgi:hypothetical protein